MKKTKIFANLIPMILIASSILMSVLIFFNTFGEDIWYDEVFSLVYAREPFADIVRLTSYDVHPPFYYFYLKVMTAVLGTVFSKATFIMLSKLSSLLPLFAVYVISLTKIRKKYSVFTASVFMFLVTFMPKLSDYYVEIRMYSLSLLILFCLFLSSVNIAEDLLNDKDLKIRDFVLFCIFGLLGAYTQYFTCVAVIGIYLALLFFMIRSDIEKKRGYLKAYLICMAASILCYLPWIPKLLSQLSAVSSSYWIEPMSIRSIPGVIKFIFTPTVSGGSWDYIPAVLMIIVTAAVVVVFLRKKMLDTYIAFAGAFVIIFVTAVGFVFSLAGHPIFVYRYLIPALGVFWFGLAYMIGRIFEGPDGYFADKKESGGFFADKKSPGTTIITCALALALSASFAFGAYCSMNAFLNEEGKKLSLTGDTVKALNDIPDGSMIVTNFDQMSVLMRYYFDKELNREVTVCLLEDAPDDTAMIMLGGSTGSNSESINFGDNAASPDKAPIISNVTIEDVAGYVTASGSAGCTDLSTSPVYFFGSFNSREDILDALKDCGVDSDEEGSYLLERYWFNIYRLK